MKTLLKTLVIGMSAAGLALAGSSVLAADKGESAPATEHQEEALKKKDESGEAYGSSRKEATGGKESSDETELPATEHQEEALKKKDESGEAYGSSRKEATGGKESSDETELPATEHQEEALQGEQGTGNDTRQQMEDPEAPR